MRPKAKTGLSARWGPQSTVGMAHERCGLEILACEATNLLNVHQVISLLACSLFGFGRSSRFTRQMSFL